MSELTTRTFSEWLDRYGDAWRSGDADGVTKLFSAEARYEETPFDEPMIGHGAIRRYWAEGAGMAQKEIRFGYDMLSVRNDTGIAHWTASFVRIPSGIFVELDGVLLARFSPDGLCVQFREWWHLRERTT